MTWELVLSLPVGVLVGLAVALPILGPRSRGFVLLLLATASGTAALADVVLARELPVPWWALGVVALVLLVAARNYDRPAWPDILAALTVVLIGFAVADFRVERDDPAMKVPKEQARIALPKNQVEAADGSLNVDDEIVVALSRRVGGAKSGYDVSERYEATLQTAVPAGEPSDDVAIGIARGEEEANVEAFLRDLADAQAIFLEPAVAKPMKTVFLSLPTDKLQPPAVELTAGRRIAVVLVTKSGGLNTGVTYVPQRHTATLHTRVGARVAVTSPVDIRLKRGVDDTAVQAFLGHLASAETIYLLPA